MASPLCCTKHEYQRWREHYTGLHFDLEISQISWTLHEATLPSNISLTAHEFQLEASSELHLFEGVRLGMLYSDQFEQGCRYLTNDRTNTQ